MMAPIHHNNSTNLSWKNKNHFMKACCHVILTIATCYEDIGMQSDIVAPSNWNKIAVSGSDQLCSNVKSSSVDNSSPNNSQQSVSSIIPELLSKLQLKTWTAALFFVPRNVKSSSTKEFLQLNDSLKNV